MKCLHKLCHGSMHKETEYYHQKRSRWLRVARVASVKRARKALQSKGEILLLLLRVNLQYLFNSLHHQGKTPNLLKKGGKRFYSQLTQWTSYLLRVIWPPKKRKDNWVRHPKRKRWETLKWEMFRKSLKKEFSDKTHAFPQNRPRWPKKTIVAPMCRGKNAA